MRVVVRFAPHEANPRPGWILDKTQKEAIKQTMVADKAADMGGPGRRPRRPRPARRSARRAG